MLSGVQTYFQRAVSLQRYGNAPYLLGVLNLVVNLVVLNKHYSTLSNNLRLFSFKNRLL